MGFPLPKTKEMLRRRAASWLARLQSERDPDIQHKFEQWRDSDQRHAEAFEAVRRTYQQAGLLRHSSMAGSDQQQPAIRKAEWRSRRALATAAAAAVVVLAPAGILLIRNEGLPLAGTDALMLMSSVGEIKQVDLADGSKVTLDTATRVDVEIGQSRRGARLRYGRARFHIAAASAPFVVETASSAIMAHEAVIDVDQGVPHDRVEVLAGTADVRGIGQSQASPVALGAGQSAKVSSGGAERTTAVAAPADWTRGMLQFDGTPLVEAIALANRYSERHIILAGDLQALRVTGAFRAGDTRGLAKALAAAFRLSLEHRADGNLVLSRNPLPRLRNKKGG